VSLILAYTPPGVPGGHPTLPEAVDALRQDLFDRLPNSPDGATTRWANDDLARALDRAVDAYSAVAPLVRSVMTATLPGARAYAYPGGAWWIESVEYPSGRYPPVFVPFEETITPSLGAPATAPSATEIPGKGLLAGTYTWSVSHFKSGGETTPGPASAPLTTTDGAALLGGIPLGPPGTVGRNIYRTRVDGAQAGGALAGRILDNTTTTWVDAMPDVALAPAAPAADTTANLAQFILKLAPGRVPVDTGGIITVAYAAKHALTPAGTSILERHRDAVLLGAAAYAMGAYQTGTNDLFEYQDGEMRDRVDEHTVPVAWLAATKRALADFKVRLGEIKRERNAGVAAVARWGDVPVHWGWT